MAIDACKVVQKICHPFARSFLPWVLTEGCAGAVYSDSGELGIRRGIQGHFSGSEEHCTPLRVEIEYPLYQCPFILTNWSNYFDWMMVSRPHRNSFWNHYDQMSLSITSKPSPYSLVSWEVLQERFNSLRIASALQIASQFGVKEVRETSRKWIVVLDVFQGFPHFLVFVRHLCRRS